VVSPAGRRTVRVVPAPSTPVPGTPIDGTDLGAAGDSDAGASAWISACSRCDSGSAAWFDSFVSPAAGSSAGLVTPAGISAGSVAPARGAFLRLGLPIGAAEAFGGGEIPPAGISGISDGFQIARQFERDHRVASFGEKDSSIVPRGSFPVRALRIRAVICFQSAIQ